MTTDEEAAQIGVLIRQLRRQRNITQAQLGAERYSKSYVSAVENNIIQASPEALQFFAEQLGQSGDTFAELLKDTGGQKQDLQEPRAPGDQPLSDEGYLMLRLLLKRVDHANVRTLRDFLSLVPALISALSSSEQGSYFFLEGLMAQDKQKYEVALSAFERALPLVSAQLQPAILDALGQYYYLMRAYSTALHYHQRALVLLRNTASQQPEQALLFSVELHCSEDYRALGAYTLACDMYESAQSYLRADHEMKSGALLYLGWGYCIYELSYRMAAQGRAARERGPLEKVEQGFQRAIRFATQSRDVSQIGGDSVGEVAARLLLAVVELDFSAELRRSVSANGRSFPASCFTLLDDAEEQCHRVLEPYQNMLGQSTAPQAPTIYIALAYIVRASIQRALLARLSGQDIIASQARTLASYLCQQALDALGEPAFLWTLLSADPQGQAERPIGDEAALPRLPELPDDAPHFRPLLPGRVEVYCVAGEVAEELGRAALSPDDARNCYTCADSCFDEALALVNVLVSSQGCEPGYMLRCHQRSVHLLEERLAAAPQECEKTTRTLATRFANGLFEVQNAFVAAQFPSSE